jgi:uncharacterized protein (DUF2235 family)
MNDQKSIILFSDGTGNSSAKLFKTNVWRMYEAVDLGPPANGKRAQISYYDDGVGTSGFKPLAVLGGAFGWGLKRNVLDIYRYACRNYRPGDEIYAFGFSRGAFTTRIVIALIASQGLVRSSSESELRQKSLAAYRAFRTEFLPRRLQRPTRLARRIRNFVIHRILRRPAHVPDECDRPIIRFVGVWDTVAAYGGPITEITRAIDNWIYPLSMPNYELSDQVQCARHALAIDDERDAFHPLLWDETHEEVLKREKRVGPNRLQQVWFTGMHADVGGGYPDESLSYVSLLWMMEEAEQADLRTLNVVKDRIKALASSYGPIHDSRTGVAAYYRYQPRKIAAWLDPVDVSTLSLRDPAIRRHGARHGLLRSVKVHESVINRIAAGTDRYAPITLPDEFEVFPPQAQGENVPQSDSQTPQAPPSTDAPKPLVSPTLRERLEHAARGRAAATEPIWNFVWWRRLTYFATLTATLLLAALPFIVDRLPSPPILADGRTWIGGPIRLLSFVLPTFAGEWVEVYADHPFYALLFGGLIIVLLRVSTTLESTLRDRARQVWRGATEDAPLPEPRTTRLQRFRNGERYQRLVQLFKWYVLPDGVVTPLIAVLAIWLGLAACTQARLPFLESDLLCQPSPSEFTPIIGTRGEFRTRDLCSRSFGGVEQGTTYVVSFDVVDPWFDSTLAADPRGVAAADFRFGAGYLGAPFRRVVDANYLQPVIVIRRPTSSRAHQIFVGKNAQIYPLSVVQDASSKTLYTAEFKAPRTGELFLFANDAMIPLTADRWGKYNYRYFYEQSGDSLMPGNRGSACVTIVRADTSPQLLPGAAAGGICDRAESRARSRTFDD